MSYISELESNLLHKNSVVRIEAIRALCQVKDSDVVDLLIDALKDEDSDVRKEAVWALGQINDRRALKPLVDKFKDVSKVAKEAQRVLEDIGPQALEFLIPALNDDDAKLRKRIVNTLGKIRAPGGLEHVIAALSDNDSNVRKEAAEILLKIKSNSSVDGLIGALKDTNSDVRSIAVDALGQIQDIRATFPLIAALKDENEDRGTRYKARRALENIGTPIIRSLVENLTDWRCSEDISIILNTLDWKPESEEEQIHYWVAKRNRLQLTENWVITKRILLNDIIPDQHSSIINKILGFFRTKNENRNIEYHIVQNALFAFIGIGKQEIIPLLIEKLYTKGNKIVAEAYLNCGHEELSDAAREWARQRGYEIKMGSGFHPVSWGRM